MKPVIYVSHSKSIREKVFNDVIPILEQFFIVENPFLRRKHALRGKTDAEIRKYLPRKISQTWVAGHDLYQMKKCDGMLVIHPYGPSYGSDFEMGYAFFHLAKRNEIFPVSIAVSEKYSLHPWLQHYCIDVCTITGERSLRDEYFFSKDELSAIKLAIHSLLTFFDLWDMHDLKITFDDIIEPRLKEKNKK